MISAYDYVSYKDFIRDYYKEQKRTAPIFSYKVFAEKAGFLTKTFIPKIISGEKKLAKRSTELIVRAMNLSKKESVYFEALVNFNNAKDMDKKEFLFNKVLSLNKKSKNFGNDFLYFSKWYHVVIYELLGFLDWKRDYNILAKHISPQITARQAKKAVELLIELGLVQEESPGCYVHTGVMKADNEITLFALKRFNQTALQLGMEAFKSDRDEYTSTVGGSVSLETLSEIIVETIKFKDKITRMIDADKSKDRVYLMNLQLFPISRKVKS